MKTIFTFFLLAYMAVANSSYSQCSVGGNGIALNTTIAIDGNMTDWTTILNDADNNTYDASPDTDAPISDVGRDFTRFAFTENISTLFLYFQRAGSVNNSVDLLFYLDVNNNGLLETNEPVIAISWSGSNGNTQVDIYNYNGVAAGGDPITGDGSKMPGTLSLRVRLGNLGKGSVNGVSLEVGIPFTELYKKSSISNTDSLATAEQFKFHISSINGSVSSVPGSNSVNDNFQGCFSGFAGVLAINDKNKTQHSKTQKPNENSLKLNNPFYDDLTIRYETVAPVSAMIKLYNLSGTVIYAQTKSFTKGLNVIEIPGINFASKGLYLIEVQDEYNKRITLKALKL